MTVYKKLTITTLAFITSQTLHAMTINPIQVQSGAGELLYAEMTFQNADTSVPMQVELANSNDLANLGVNHNPPEHLNFYTRRNSQGNGAIVITSSRPLSDNELNIVVKIQEGNQTRLQHIRLPLKRGNNVAQKASMAEKPLTPQVIVSDKDIALNLPQSRSYAQAVKPGMLTNKSTASGKLSGEKPLVINAATPPALMPQTVTNTPAANNTALATPTVKTQTIATPAPVNQAAPATVVAPVTAPAIQPVIPANTAASAAQAQVAQAKSKPVNTETAQAAPAKPAPEAHKTETTKASADKAEPHKTEAAKAQPAKTDKPKAVPAESNLSSPVTTKTAYVVQNNESLWKIASRIASETKQSVPQVMQQIKTNNKQAFIQGDSNRLRRGAVLNLGQHNAKTAQTVKVSPNGVQKPMQPHSTKYRLNQAEMSLVAENQQDSAHGSAKRNTQHRQTTNELSLKVMTARGKTVKLQRNVNQLDHSLQQKDQRLKLLNAKLAQLQQQVKQQEQAKRTR